MKILATDKHGCTRIRNLCSSVFICGLMIFPLSAQKLDDCRILRHHGELAEARTCFSHLAASPDPYLRAEGLWGLEQYREANEQFREALKLHPNSVEYRV